MLGSRPGRIGPVPEKTPSGIRLWNQAAAQVVPSVRDVCTVNHTPLLRTVSPLCSKNPSIREGFLWIRYHDRHGVPLEYSEEYQHLKAIRMGCELTHQLSTRGHSL